MSKVSADFTWSLSCNHDRNWRDRLAACVRFLARLIDGRVDLAPRIESLPVLNSDQQAQIMFAGLEHSRRLLRDTVCEEALTDLMRGMHPDLFDE